MAGKAAKRLPAIRGTAAYYRFRRHSVASGLILSDFGDMGISIS